MFCYGGAGGFCAILYVPTVYDERSIVKCGRDWLRAGNVHSIINGKVALRYAGSEVEAMKAIATAHQNRSLQEFETALATYPSELNNDPIIRSQLAALYDTLLEQNLVRIIEPFSRVEIERVAEIVKLPTAQVETKLSQMILDKAFHGILDQGAGCLIVFDEPPEDKTYDTTIDTLKQMEKVVESLYEKVRPAFNDTFFTSGGGLELPRNCHKRMTKGGVGSSWATM
ncbi:hypothetical protein BC936DRAFT_137593 [Jimgerdemannia flammicorona]|uniref:PCI domain-containing protein n=1 Tax=Jimgerdemannia flammicorona TaxID=994334 RepID=A0A433CWZ7_9FUNG|nr:hypothetical protein BC936DRAFT_137593 [Jimgerdemannia flammicorona]